MQKILFTFLLVGASFTMARSQSLPSNTCGVVYSYDAAGNRTQRKYVCNNALAGNAVAVAALKQLETEKVQQVSALYPNPTTGMFKVTFVIPLKRAQVTVMDMAGRTLQQHMVSGSQVDFDISHLPAGMYWLKIQDGDNPLTYKVIKQ